MFTIVFNEKITRKFTKEKLIKKSDLIRRLCEDEPDLDKVPLNGLNVTYDVMQVFACWCEKIEDNQFCFRDSNQATDRLRYCEFAWELDAYMGTNVIFYYIMDNYKKTFNLILEYEINFIRFAPLFFKLKMGSCNKAEELFNYLYPKHQHELVVYAMHKNMNINLRKISWLNGIPGKVNWDVFMYTL